MAKRREWRLDSDKTQTNKLEWWIILKISLQTKAGVPKTLAKPKLRPNDLYFPQNTLLLTEFSGEFSDSHSIFGLCALRYLHKGVRGLHVEICPPPPGGGALLYKRLLGMCRWMGSYFHDWTWLSWGRILVEWGWYIFWVLGVRQFFILTVSKRTKMSVL